MIQQHMQFDRIMARIKNNPVVAFVIVGGTIVIAIATFTEAARNLLSLVIKEKPPLIAGRWLTGVLTNPFDGEDTFRFSFNFEVQGNRVLGTGRQTSTTGWYDIRDSILDGKIEGKVISFHIQKLMLLGDHEVEYTDFYSGLVSEDGVEFVLHSDRRGGFPPQQFVAKRE